MIVVRQGLEHFLFLLVQFMNFPGVVVFGISNGFWLIHSVPKFPRNDTYEYPITGRHYGQMGLCISMSYSQLHKIGIFQF